MGVDVDEAKKYGAEGGKKRAANMTAAQRKAAAAAAARARWGSKLPTATYGSADRPLRIGDIEIPCYVLDDGRRVIAQRGLKVAIGMSMSGGTSGEQRVARFVDSLAAKGIEVNDLALRINTPIIFSIPGVGNPAFGYEATIIPDICDVIWEAYQSGVLQKQQAHIGLQAQALTRALAKTGIVALVDEATGFQEVRARDALAKILEAFVQKELRKWVRTFPPAFYEQLCRLRGVAYPPESMKLPQYFGKLTNSIVYDRLAPMVKDELKRLTPKDARGRPKQKLFQRLTEDVGHPKLLEHLASVVALMRISPDYDTFHKHLDQALPRWDDTLPLPLNA